MTEDDYDPDQDHEVPFDPDRIRTSRATVEAGGDSMRIHIPLLDRFRRRPTGTCPKCDHDTRLDQTYCQVCGYAIVEQTKADIAKIKPL